MSNKVDCVIIKMIKNRERLKFVDRDSLLKLINDERFLIMQPTLSAISHQHKNIKGGEMYGESKNFLMTVFERRVNLILNFAEDIVEKCQDFNKKNPAEEILFPIEFVALTGDSHNGARRPVLIKKTDGEGVILKFSDPRNYLATQRVMRFISQEVGVDLTLPSLKAFNENEYYFSDFLKEEEVRECEIPEFMFGMGALTAVAFCMGFVDLHLENIVAVGKKPLIIDPECMLYNFAIGASVGERLWSTGLLSHNVHLSSLRGGISKSHPLVDFKMHRVKCGIKYTKSVRPHRNKVRMSSGDFADAKIFKRDILSGYDAAYNSMIKSKDGFISLLEDAIDDDLKIRYLVRKTRHYTSVIYMLNLPSIYGEDWEGVVLSKFKESGSFLEGVPSGVFRAEMYDLLNRDVPYFWVRAGEGGEVYHSTGSVHNLALIESPKQRVINDFLSLGDGDRLLQKTILEDFLELDI